MAVQTLHTGLHVNLMAVGDWLVWSCQNASAAEKNTANYPGEYQQSGE